ncbi:hypothetical protein GCM10010129_56460 [Streptomyces fumigatiscleroticus]|nr:hypothetical protein GCM10010129_56460 [Streptomyces fumigatiscleroticus]
MSAVRESCLTGIALTAQDLLDADQIAEQLSLDRGRHARLAAILRRAS